MSIEEGVYVHKRDYQNTHGKNPSGHGSWAFGHTRDPKPEHIFRHHGKFGDAQKAAIAYAKQHGHSEIHVLTESILNEDFEPISDIITLVANDQAAEASSIVNDLLSARVLDSLQAHKETIAQSLFAPSADSLSEEIVQEEFESVEDFKKRGGTVKQIPAHKSYSAPKAQKIKVPYRMGSKAISEGEVKRDPYNTDPNKVLASKKTMEDRRRALGRGKPFPASSHGASMRLALKHNFPLGVSPRVRKEMAKQYLVKKG